MFRILLRGMFSETNLYNINKNNVSKILKNFHIKRWHLYIAIAMLNPSIYIFLVHTDSWSCHKWERYESLALDYVPNWYGLREDSRPHGVKSFQRKLENGRIKENWGSCTGIATFSDTYSQKSYSFVSPQVNVSCMLYKKVHPLKIFPDVDHPDNTLNA